MLARDPRRARPGDEAAMTIGFSGQIGIGLVAGLGIGAFHFATLWWNTRLFTSGTAGKAIVVQLGRIAVAVAALTFLARLGFAALLSGAFGLLVVRPLLVRRFGELR
jgi:F1F0 ATPase subunit 2